MSVINTCDKYNTEELILEKPIKIDDIYISNMSFTLQTPKITIDKISKKITFLLTEELEKLFNDFDNKIINLLSENSKEFFEDELTLEDAEEIYRGSIKQSRKDCKITVSINRKLSIFNKHKEQLELNNLNSGDIVICLLKCKKIVFYKNYCEPLWEVFQMKYKEINKTNKIDTKVYMIVEDPNDNYDSNDSNDSNDITDTDISQIKKIKIKEHKEP